MPDRLDVTDVSAVRAAAPHAAARARLGSRAELDALAEVAKAGIHPLTRCRSRSRGPTQRRPGFVAGFVAHHEETLAAWTPEEWRLNLLAFHDGAPVGSQALRATEFSADRTVDTGSWLGVASSGSRARHGDAGRGARARVRLPRRACGASGWLEGGAAQSAGVSARLGYLEIGTHLERPRGDAGRAPRPRPRRSRVGLPFAVAIVGVEQCLPLFGAPAGELSEPRGARRRATGCPRGRARRDRRRGRCGRARRPS